MKIVFVINSLESGGAERVLSIIANGLLRYNYDIKIISKQKLVPFYNLDSRINIVFPENQINYKNKFIRIQTSFKQLLEIFWFLNTERPDVVISFSTTTNASIIMLSKILNLKVVACEHNNYKLNLNKPIIWFIKRIIYKLADVLTVLTKSDLELFYSKFLNNVRVMPNPLSFEPLEEVEAHREENILSIGNLERWKQKGFDSLIKIFQKVAKENKNWNLIIAGSGNTDYLKSKIPENLENRIIFLGEVKDVESLMKKTSIFALTSRWEGLPMVLMEAMSQGMAVISYDCYSGPGEMIINDKNGLLVRDQDELAFVKGLLKLISNQELRLKLGFNAIQTSEKYLPNKLLFQWNKLIIETVQSDEKKNN